jgi:hypothetical protein
MSPKHADILGIGRAGFHRWNRSQNTETKRCEQPSLQQQNAKHSPKPHNKQVPGRHIQMGAEFPTFKRKEGEKIRRFQNTAINDTSNFRAVPIGCNKAVAHRKLFDVIRNP